MQTLKQPSGKRNKKVLMHVYCCAECGQTTAKIVTPKTDNCPESPFHRWINIGREGSEKYECMNCKAEVHTIKLPNSYGCKTSLFHEWRRV